MDRYYHDFAQRLKEERERMQLTIADMSLIAQIHPSHYQKVERGYKRFSLCELQSICAAGVDAYYLFTGKRSTDAVQYEELLKDAESDQIFDCLFMLNMLASAKSKSMKEPHKQEWKQIYLSTKYMIYVNAVLRDEKNIFKVYREKNEMRQADLAGELGIDVKKMRALENDALEPDSEIILKMYERCGISPAAFLQDKRCIQNEVACLLSTHPGKVGDDLFVMIRTALFFFC